MYPPFRQRRLAPTRYHACRVCATFGGENAYPPLIRCPLSAFHPRRGYNACGGTLQAGSRVCATFGGEAQAGVPCEKAAAFSRMRCANAGWHIHSWQASPTHIGTSGTNWRAGQDCGAMPLDRNIPRWLNGKVHETEYSRFCESVHPRSASPVNGGAFRAFPVNVNFSRSVISR